MTDGYNTIRIKNIRNPNCIIAVNLKDNSIIKLRKDDVPKYHRIQPVGLMSFFIVSIGNGQKDVIVTLHRMEDMDIGEDIPFIAARQSIINMFAMPLTNNIEEVPYGLCMSKKTCPPNVDFNIVLDNKKVISNNVICVYLDDVIGNIIKYINTTPYDSIITRFKRVFDPQSYKNVGNTLYEFLDNNGWMSEFDNAYNIYNINYPDFNIDKDYHILLIELEKSLERKILDMPYIHLYDNSIDLSRLVKEECVFFRKSDYDNRVYIAKVTLGDEIRIMSQNQKLDYLELINKCPSFRA